MSTKNHRLGGKFGGSHTTVIPVAGLVSDIAVSLPEVNKVVLGFIKAGLSSVGGQRRVKITRRDGNIFLAIRDNTSHQEITVYTSDLQRTALSIARSARSIGLHVSFGESGSTPRAVQHS